MGNSSGPIVGKGSLDTSMQSFSADKAPVLSLSAPKTQAQPGQLGEAA
jgi:hypothetical protein